MIYYSVFLCNQVKCFKIIKIYLAVLGGRWASLQVCIVCAWKSWFECPSNSPPLLVSAFDHWSLVSFLWLLLWQRTEDIHLITRWPEMSYTKPNISKAFCWHISLLQAHITYTYAHVCIIVYLLFLLPIKRSSCWCDLCLWPCIVDTNDTVHKEQIHLAV